MFCASRKDRTATPRLLPIWALALLLSAAGSGVGFAHSAQAADCLVLSVQLTAYQQDLVEEQVSPTLMKSTVKQVKITTQDLLDRLAQYHSLPPFPAGTQICLDTEEEAKILDENGTLLLTVNTAVFLVGGTDTVDVVTANLASGSVVAKNWSTGVIEFHWSPSIDFFLTGLSLSKASWKYPSETVKMSSSTKVSGVGEYGGEFAVFAGKISFKGTLPLEE